MKLLITGASGVLGQNLIDYLIGKGYTNFVLTDIVEFDYSRYIKNINISIDFRKGDIREEKFVNGIIENVDMVIHTAAASPSFSDDVVYSTIVGGTNTLLKAASEKNIKRFVYISSTSVYGVPKKVPVLETDNVDPYDSYNKSKIIAEEACRKYREKGMCIPVLRPRTFIGPGRLGSFIFLFSWAQEGRNFPMVGKGNNIYQFLDVEDLCQAVYLCMVQPEDSVNDVFNIGAGEYSSMRKDYQAVLDYAGFKKRIKTLPVKPVLFVLTVLAFFKLSPLYKRMYKKFNRDYYVSIEKAEKKLGYRPLYSNSKSLVRNYQWYLDNCNTFRNKTGNGNNVPWKEGILKFARIFF